MIKFFLIAGLLVAGVLWFADHPGLVAINWEGWVIETNVPLLGLLTLVLAMSLSIIWRSWLGIIHIPRYFRRKCDERKAKKIIDETARGLSAVAGGDAYKGNNSAAKAREMSADNPLTLLLSAQSAVLSGDIASARRDFNLLAVNKNTAILGLKGLANLELKEGDATLALEHMRRANYSNPGLPTILSGLFDLQIRAKIWDEALQSLETGKSKGLFPRYIRQKAVVLHEMAFGTFDTDEGLKSIRRAIDCDPDFIPAHVLRAKLLAKSGKDKKAADVIIESWKHVPHPDLVEIYLKLWDDNEMSKVGRVQRLAQANPKHAQSKLALAQAFLAAKLWGEARAQLEVDVKSGTCGKEFYLLMAQIEKGEKGENSPNLLSLWEKIALHPAAQTWYCQDCGRKAHSFQSFCNHCGEFGTIDWTYPLLAEDVPVNSPSLLPSLL